MFENSNLTTGTVTDGQINMNWCGFRLPCGLCTRTNTPCPMVLPTPSWTITCNTNGVK